MKKVLVEEDPILKVVPVVLDPATPEEHRRAVADFYRFDEPDFEGWCSRLRERLPNLYPAKVVLAKDQDDLRSKIGDADGVIVESLRIGVAELDAATKLSVVQKWGGIVSNIDVDACKQRDVAVSSHRRYVNIAVAEQALAFMLALGRRICELDGVVEEDRLREAGWDPTPYDRRYTGNSNFARITGLQGLHGSVLGALGLGEIGREVAMRANAFGMKVLYHQRSRMSANDEASLGATYCSFEEMLQRSDFVSIHLPLNESTRGLLDRKALQQMKNGAILVNIARAEIVDRDALMEALDAGRLGGFGLDVGYAEPAQPGEPLLKYKNVILVPHTAPAHRRYGLNDWEEMLTKMADAMVRRPAKA